MNNLTEFRLACTLTLTGICLLLTFSVAPTFAATNQDRCTETITRLTSENKKLSHDVFRAEAKVKALREAEDKFDPVAIVGGIGWIVGIFGSIAWLKSRKKG